MTREEAIKELRGFIGHLTEECQEAIKVLFPELKESEDERIRKAILGLVYLDGIEPILTKCSVTRSDILTYLEKQKINTEGDFGRGYDCGYKACLNSHGAEFFEKQKENPKSADSIPSDCVSDAKCENRWHKVEDSLPDNGRLVLAQDNLGNRLLARYDGEGNWEVRVYDNEDYYCRNTITKWCEIPSEKQKEQKPAEWSEEDEAHLKWLCRIIRSHRLHGELSLKEESELGKWIDKWINHEPQQENKWSKEDEHRYGDAIYFLETAKKHYADTSEIELAIDWLKSLRPQPKQDWIREQTKNQ